MHRYHTILLDADGTLFDFAAAEAAALREAFARFCLPFSAQALAEYHTINQRLWLRLEEGRITRQQLACRRFEELFARLELAAPPEEFARFGRIAEELGFSAVASSPLVRSSYHAGELHKKGESGA